MIKIILEISEDKCVITEDFGTSHSVTEMPIGRKMLVLVLEILGVIDFYQNAQQKLDLIKERAKSGNAK